MTPPSTHGRPEGPVFFVSYAHAKRDKPVWDFVDSLSAHLRELLGRRAGTEPGFVDYRSLQVGESWQRNLDLAVRTATVLIPLVSPSYLTSKECTREWTVYVEGRTAANRPKAIVPVLWVPLRSALPSRLRGIQYFAPSASDLAPVRRKYEDNGLYGLQASHLEEYQGILWYLAKHVRDVYYESEPFEAEVNE